MRDCLTTMAALGAIAQLKVLEETYKSDLGGLAKSTLLSVSGMAHNALLRGVETYKVTSAFAGDFRCHFPLSSLLGKKPYQPGRP